MTLKITDLQVYDIRYKTASFIGDALHTDPDYSAAYVILQTSDPSLEGHGLTFTLGRGTEVIVTAIKSLQPYVVGQTLSHITTNFGNFWKGLVCESQLRWLGPEKGVIHLATAAIVNALWDLWAKSVKKPLWKLLVDLSPEELVSTIDFRYLHNYLTPEEAISILKKKRETAQEREKHLLQHGYPAYNTSVGWLGIDDSTIGDRCKAALDSGFHTFKLKVGLDIDQDKRRLRLVREAIGYGPEVKIMIDANQKWEANEAVEYVKQLKEFQPKWIEEPTSPDDILGHLAVREGLRESGIGVATGEHCHNRVIFKQLLQAKAVDIVQPDATRLGGINEVLAVILMAAKSEYVEGGVPVCLHAGGIGLCELNQHLCYFDYVSVSGRLDGRVMEYVDHLHEHFYDPVRINEKGRYVPPCAAGASLQMKPESLKNAEFKKQD